MSKKYILILTLFALFSLPVRAFDPSAFVTQSAQISDGGYATIIFDTAFDNNSNSISLPFFEIRHVVGKKYRLGFLTDLKYANADDSSAFGFGNVTSTFEMKLIENGFLDYASYYTNVEFPTAHNDLLSEDKHGLEFGITFQEHFLKKYTFFSETGYKLNFPDSGSSFHSIVSNQAIVYEGFEKYEPYIESLLEISSNGNSSIRLLPGLTIPITDDFYTYVGFPIGLNSQSPDYGFLVGATINF